MFRIERVNPRSTHWLESRVSYSHVQTLIPVIAPHFTESKEVEKLYEKLSRKGKNVDVGREKKEGARGQDSLQQPLESAVANIRG